MAQAQEELDDDAVIVAANRLRTGGIAGFFAKERFEIIVESSHSPRSLLDLAEQVSDGERQASPFASVLTRIADDVGIELEDLDLRSDPTPPDTSMPTVQRTFPPPPPGTSTNPVTAQLTDLGLPPRLVACACRADPEDGGAQFGGSLYNALRQLPSPPALPRFAGAIVVVVGERLEALSLARSMAIDLCLDPEDVVLASPSYRGRGIPAGRRITETGAARELGNRWRHQGRTRVVAVESSMGPADVLWASHLLGALQPSAVWAIAHANQKNEDVVSWSDRLGGIDALALTHLESSVSPAALLQTGIPIARLDNRPATAALWAALLTERLAA